MIVLDADQRVKRRRLEARLLAGLGVAAVAVVALACTVRVAIALADVGALLSHG